jgi:site-specific DNA-methyltransferase (adenine-specific)
VADERGRGYIAVAQSVEWLTPPEMLMFLNQKWGPFSMDPAPYPKLPGVEGTRGLHIPWAGRVFVNPPYGLGLRDWVEKGYVSTRVVGLGVSASAESVTMLLPARTDTQWFQQYAEKAETILIEGRVKYLKPGSSDRTPAPFPSCILHFGADARLGIRVGRVPGAGSA